MYRDMPAQCGTPQQFLRCCLGVFKRFGVIEAVLPETMPNGFCMGHLVGTGYFCRR